MRLNDAQKLLVNLRYPTGDLYRLKKSWLVIFRPADSQQWTALQVEQVDGSHVWMSQIADGRDFKRKKDLLTTAAAEVD